MATKQTNIRKPVTVAEFVAAHKGTNAKVIRRKLREIAGKKPKTGWKITPALAKQLITH